MTYPACPDCAVELDCATLAHEPTCPLGLGQDAVSEEDRLWFALRPAETTRRRPPHWSEVAVLRAMGLVPDGAEVVGDVVVHLVSPGIRARLFDGLYFLSGEAA